VLEPSSSWEPDPAGKVMDKLRKGGGLVKARSHRCAPKDKKELGASVTHVPEERGRRMESSHGGEKDFPQRLGGQARQSAPLFKRGGAAKWRRPFAHNCTGKMRAQRKGKTTGDSPCVPGNETKPFPKPRGGRRGVNVSPTDKHRGVAGKDMKDGPHVASNRYR